ncbi:MAG TPA: prolyl oligopeptidase family serine peptidase [Candidatus Acidoferrales bacterium]|nr:prolyl oligopeptidase family serine peptidase [Candidatus Acidoferrales bacterium]
MKVTRNHPQFRQIGFVMGLLAVASFALAPRLVAQTTYQKPPKEILDVMNAPATPIALPSPNGAEMLLAEPVRYPSIAELARPMYRLAGVRIDPASNGQHNPFRFRNLVLLSVSDGRSKPIQFAAGEGFSRPDWAPDGKHFYLNVEKERSVELWIGAAAAGTIERIPGVALNAVLGEPCRWMPGSAELLCRTVPANRVRPPAESRVPTGPIIQESFGNAAPAPTFEDLLANKHDEDLFDCYAASQLAIINIATGKAAAVGKPGIYDMADPSPSGHLILVARIHHPYSYIVPFERFPHEVEVWDRAGRSIYKLADLPLAEAVPIGGVPTGPRDYAWQPTAPATLVWVEALDGGDPRAKAENRDHVLWLAEPFKEQPSELARTEYRFAGLVWGERGDLAILREFDRNRLWERSWFLNPQRPSEKPRLVWDMSQQDRYHAPGQPEMKMLLNGHEAMLQSGDSIFLRGPGASPEGDHPFLDRFDTSTLHAERLFHCDKKSYEEVVALTSSDGSKFITRHETPNDPPNYYLRTAREDSPRALTHFADPTPQLRAIHKELVTYTRADGVPLSMTLYLPPDYKQGERRPAVVWAYPREFTDARVASQITGSPNRFTEIPGLSSLWFLLDGYVVLDGPTMPVIGPPRTANDTYVEQIVSSAKSAIDKAAAMGVIDPNRVGVGGHSYGAFMTANLLAHSDLFKAGIARSGAYNRTLTPFGFQNERRTLWEAPDVYLKMSPFMFADKLKTPILLIHGMADNNSGTFPIQSERMFAALKGNGGSVRYVQLPDEAHGYAARESIEHMIWEMLRWFDLYLKSAPAKQ